MPWVKAFMIVAITLLFTLMAAGPMFGTKPAPSELVELLKAVVLIVAGYLYGSSVSSAKKDEVIADAMKQPPPPP